MIYSANAEQNLLSFLYFRSHIRNLNGTCSANVVFNNNKRNKMPFFWNLVSKSRFRKDNWSNMHSVSSFSTHLTSTHAKPSVGKCTMKISFKVLSFTFGTSNYPEFSFVLCPCSVTRRCDLRTELSLEFCFSVSCLWYPF